MAGLRPRVCLVSSGMKRIVKSCVVLALIAIGLAAIGVGAESARKMSKKEVKALIANASSRADHEKLAAYYQGEAARLKAEQRDHEEEAAEYFKNPSSHPVPKYPTLGQHCRDLAGYYGMAAQKAEAMAEMHQTLAKDSK